jgi:AcrR family transcriptional regulator
MPRPRRSPEEVARMRERMLDVALELLREGGPQAISIRALAERLGVSHMVFYTYFDSRAELLRALSHRQRERVGQRRAQMLEQARQGDVVQVVRDALAHYAHISERAPRIYELLLVHCVESSPEGFTKPTEILAHDLEHLQALVELGISRGAFVARDPKLAAKVAFAIVNGPLILLHSGRLTGGAPARCERDELIQESLSAAMVYLIGPQATEDGAGHTPNTE